jgi:hypothetical protein
MEYTKKQKENIIKAMREEAKLWNEASKRGAFKNLKSDIEKGKNMYSWNYDINYDYLPDHTQEKITPEQFEKIMKNGENEIWSMVNNMVQDWIDEQT